MGEVWNSHRFVRRFRCVRFFEVWKGNKRANRDPCICNHLGRFTWRVLLVCGRFLQACSLRRPHVCVVCFDFTMLMFWMLLLSTSISNLTVTSKLIILFPPANQDFHNSVSLNTSASKAAINSVLAGHSSKDLHITCWPSFHSVNIVTLGLALFNFSLGTVGDGAHEWIILGVSHQLNQARSGSAGKRRNWNLKFLMRITTLGVECKVFWVLEQFFSVAYLTWWVITPLTSFGAVQENSLCKFYKLFVIDVSIA